MSQTQGFKESSGKRIAFLGLGKMGLPMAAALARSGFDVSAWSRDPPASNCNGIQLQPDLEKAVEGADVVIAMVFDAAAIEEMLFTNDGISAFKVGATFIDMGTTGPNAAREHALRVADRHIRYLDAPVSGGVAGAENSDLAIFVGGNAETYQACEAVLRAMGNPRLVGDVGAGQTAKLANQVIVALYIAAVAEGIRFAESQGLEPTVLLGAVAGGLADSAVLRQHGPRMAARRFDAGGASRLHLKDLRLAKDLIGADLSRLPHMSEALERFERLVGGGLGDADHSAYFMSYEP